jgi:hypothetical protein
MSDYLFQAEQTCLLSRDKALLENIKNFFSLERGIYNQGSVRDTAGYFIYPGAAQLKNMASHFSKYPLLTQKRGDFEF